jgi:hypothetical protein
MAMDRTSSGHDALFVTARVLIASVFVGLERIVTMLGGAAPTSLGTLGFSAFEAIAGLRS